MWCKVKSKIKRLNQLWIFQQTKRALNFFKTPLALPGVDPKILDPRDTYANVADWEVKAKDLAGRFINNFKKFESFNPDLVKSGPQL